MLSRPAQPVPVPAPSPIWLTIVAIMIFAMVVVGGITRLTEFGLSMVRWEPISGAIPPLDAGDWQARVRPLPLHPAISASSTARMTLEDFKAIFFWEYVHRLLGRLIGLAFALPLLWFWWRRAIPDGFGWKLGGAARAGRRCRARSAGGWSPRG